MKILYVCTGWHRHKQIISDDAKADAAYLKIKQAIADYQKFKNDTSEVVTVDLDESEASYRTEHIVMVTVDTISPASTDAMIEYNTWVRRIQNAVDVGETK